MGVQHQEISWEMRGETAKRQTVINDEQCHRDRSTKDFLVPLCDLISRTTYRQETHIEPKKPEFEDDFRIGQRQY